VIEVGCWAHARRHFYKALGSDPDRATAALSHIGALFALERTMLSTPVKKRREIRQARAAPIADAFFQWCDQEAARVLDESPIANGNRVRPQPARGASALPRRLALAAP
jgi:transposase